MEEKRSGTIGLLCSVPYFQILDKHTSHGKRYHLYLKLLLAYKLMKNSNIKCIAPVPCKRSDLLSFHSSDYIDCIEQYDPTTDMNAKEKDMLDDYGLLDDCPFFTGLEEYIKYVAGATLTACQYLINDRFQTVINWGGGRHHAGSSQANGFCYVNDIVIGILKLLQAKNKNDNKKYKYDRILYIDFDIHHGDAVEEAFWRSNRVFTLSFHHFKNGFFPGTGLMKSYGEGKGLFRSLNIPLKEGITDSNYYTIFKQVTLSVVEFFKPNLIVLQCGVDGLAHDKMSKFNLSTVGLGRCVKHILDIKPCLPMLMLGGGGYHPANTARTWLFFTVLAAQVNVSKHIPPHEEITLYGPNYELFSDNKGTIKDMNSREFFKKVLDNVETFMKSAKIKNPVEIDDNNENDNNDNENNNDNVNNNDANDVKDNNIHDSNDNNNINIIKRHIINEEEVANKKLKLNVT